MIRNGLYSLAAVAIDGMDVEVGGILILRDGEIRGGDPFVFYTGTYECSDGKWNGEMISKEHTPTTRPMAERVQHIGFSGTYNDAGAEADATVLVGKSRIRYDATLHLLAAAKLDLYGKGRSLVGSSFLPTGQPVFPLALDRSGSDADTLAANSAKAVSDDHST